MQVAIGKLCIRRFARRVLEADRIGLDWLRLDDCHEPCFMRVLLDNTESLYHTFYLLVSSGLNIFPMNESSIHTWRVYIYDDRCDGDSEMHVIP
jgi:hypothetical protein